MKSASTMPNFDSKWLYTPIGATLAAAAIRRTERPSGPSVSRRSAAELRRAASMPALGVLVRRLSIMSLAY